MSKKEQDNSGSIPWSGLHTPSNREFVVGGVISNRLGYGEAEGGYLVPYSVYFLLLIVGKKKLPKKNSPLRGDLNLKIH